MATIPQSPLERVLEALRAHGCDPQPSGDGFIAHCPVKTHGKRRGDTNPSLSVGAGGDSRVLLHCHAGCDAESIVASVGLTLGDLMPAKPPRAKIVATYPYTDQNGELIYEVVRYEPKAFKQRRPNGNGGWTWNLRDVHRVLYRLPAVIEAVKAGTTIYVVEGEKDVHNAEAAGLVATCNSGGAGKWRIEYSEALRGGNVVVVADCDDPGRSHALAVVKDLNGVAASVRAVEPAEGKDLSDHLASGKSVDDLVPLQARPTAPSHTSHATYTPRTDTGNAERLHTHAGDDVRYCYEWRKWLAWDGTRWRPDDVGRLMSLSKVVARKIRREADECPNERVADALARWAVRSESRGKRSAMVDLLACEPDIPVQHEAFDRDPWLLNCENGTLDLRTGKLRPHDREDLLTKVVPLAYDPDATCALWDAFLERILPDPEVRAFVQRAAGWSLTGDVSSQVLFFCYGLGANGKSTFLRIIMKVLGGDYAIQAPPELLTEKQQRGHPTELADLFGVRLAVSVEMGPGKTLDEVLVKQLTGGDVIRARRMREDFWQFEPTHHLWIAANHKPVIHGTDEAMWRRLMLIPFTVTIPEDERDGQLLTKLTAELPGILTWAVRGCQDWIADGLAPPDKVRAATREYRADMDVVGDFIEARCIVEPNASVRAKALFDAYVAWAEANGEPDITQQDFGGAMTERGFQRRKRKGVKWYLGLTLRSDGEGGRGGPLPISAGVSPLGEGNAPPGSGRNDGNAVGCPESSPSSPQAGTVTLDAAARAEIAVADAIATGDATAVGEAMTALADLVGPALAAAVEAELRAERAGVPDAT